MNFLHWKPRLWPKQFSSTVLSIVTCSVSQHAELQGRLELRNYSSHFTQAGTEALGFSASLVAELAREPRLYDSRTSDVFQHSVLLSSWSFTSRCVCVLVLS